MRASFKPKEAKERSFTRKLKRDGLDDQRDKLPNDLKHCLDDYNYNNVDGDYVDDNDYSYLKDY